MKSGSTKIEWIPEGGDIAWLDFKEGFGHEQKNRRPAVFLTPSYYNAESGLALVLPVTTTCRGHEFEAPILINEKPSTIICNQVHTVAWKERNLKHIGKIDDQILEKVTDMVVALVMGK